MRHRDEPKPYEFPDPVVLGEWDEAHTPGLQDALITLYRQLPQVQRAYLANIESRRPGGSIGLFVASKTGESATVVERSFDVYRRLYGTLDGLQLIFLHKDLEQMVQRRCQPFYAAA